MTHWRNNLLTLAFAASTFLTCASAAILITDHVRDALLRETEIRREAELQSAARRDASAAITLAAENERRTARSLALNKRSQLLAIVVIAGSAGFVATAGRIPPLEGRFARPPCKRGEKCQVLSARRGCFT